MATEADHLAVVRVERVLPARVPARSYAQGVVPRFDWLLDGITVVERAGGAAVDRDLEPAPPELDAEAGPSSRPASSLISSASSLPVRPSSAASTHTQPGSPRRRPIGVS
jgi:hypothetical protein